MMSSRPGSGWNGKPDHGVQEDVQEKLDAELDDYLERELAAHAEVGVRPVPAGKDSASGVSVQALAAEEEQWLRTLPSPVASAQSAPEPEARELRIPEHLKPAPQVGAAPPVLMSEEQARWAALPARLPGLAPVPQLSQPGWNLPSQPFVAGGPRSKWWVMAGAMVGASAVTLLAVGVLWSVRGSLPGRAQLMAAYVPAGTVAAVPPSPVVSGSVEEKVQPAPAPVPVAVEQVASAPQPVPVPVPVPVPAVVASPEPKVVPAPVQVAAVQAAPAVQPKPVAMAVATPVVPEPKPRRVVKEWVLEDPRDEAAFNPAPGIARAPAPPVKAAPPPPEAKGYESDRAFANQLGFTSAAPAAPKQTGVSSVWIPPDPGTGGVESLTPEDIQKVVAANQPEVATCIQRHKEAIPGLKGGRFTMRWFVEPDGATSGVAMETRALRGTAMATCIEGVVQGWKFPKSQTQSGPIRFPFVF